MKYLKIMIAVGTNIIYVTTYILCLCFVSTSGSKPKTKSGPNSAWTVGSGGKKSGSWSSGRHK